MELVKPKDGADQTRDGKKKIAYDFGIRGSRGDCAPAIAPGFKNSSAIGPKVGVKDWQEPDSTGQCQTGQDDN
ncbi:MAG: hypothetical protein GXP04_03035 [Alphaproteobacteria bacterium]|nr:hypothetical protein [Alphaproteobacteria bacterium]